ncbi:ABC transporter ATP-binding protein [Aminobacterium sp. MB27-C1]|uniref:ABC transporter ATP-binding protein n=1 Tax=Aminobacterium sp. MB27-C1 TaxID=3070661 RepID=UPI001BD19B77|nr:ABC transporter ATP-binding protein [Aminobacterium sp. MB27-C1]WMI72094.1 ABC transporter ATP-binding protein [Aminobacterium sp. MB27-C1]
MGTTLLSVDSITVRRENTTILKDMSLKVESGEVTGVLGRNGAGKSSLAYALMGLPDYIPVKGSITFLGKDITRWSITDRAKAGLTLAWQLPARYEGISIRDYLRTGTKGCSERDLEESMDFIQMNTTFLDRAIDKSLSGGERKRIELASIYLMKPRLAILDEPDSGVDLLALREVLGLLRLLADQGSGVMVITHREDVAAGCDRSYLMCDGRIILEGSAGAVKRYFMSQCRPCDGCEVGEVMRRG